MKRRTMHLWGILLVTLAIVGLLQFKFAIEAKEQLVQELNKQYVDDERAIRVLRAEWAYLNSPESLQAMSQRHLELRPLTADRIVVDPKIVPIRAGKSPERQLTPLTSGLRPREKPAWAYTLEPIRATSHEVRRSVLMAAQPEPRR